jgi:hypothetical protein
MKLPPDSVIAPEKLISYLLVRQTRGDKSAFLATAGYTLANSEQLLRDLREQVLRATQLCLRIQNLASSMRFARRSLAQTGSRFESVRFG